MLLWQSIFHVECPSQGVNIHDDGLHVECKKAQYRHFFIGPASVPGLQSPGTPKSQLHVYDANRQLS